jgi:hypothetical protein
MTAADSCDARSLKSRGGGRGYSGKSEQALKRWRLFRTSGSGMFSNPALKAVRQGLSTALVPALCGSAAGGGDKGREDFRKVTDSLRGA